MNNFAEKEFWSIVIGGSMLAANAGFINVVTLAGVFSVTVSHSTGNITRIAIAMFQRDSTTLLLVLSILLSFMFGSFVAGYYVGDNRFRLGRSYGYCLMLVSAALFLSFAFLKKELVGGEMLAAFACGLQNAMTTSYSGAVVRTTHMTGICTDIANILGQACRKDSTAEVWRLKVHVPLLFGFLIGCLVGQFAFLFMKENALLLPCFFTVYLTLPFIKEAQDTLTTISKQMIGKKTIYEVRQVGDPRNTDHFAHVVPQGTIDNEIKDFLADIEQASHRSEFNPNGSLSSLNAGGNIQMVMSPRKPSHVPQEI